MNDKIELAWKRQPDKSYLTRHGYWVYAVFRNEYADTGRQWALAAWPEGNPKARQERTGFDSMRTARLAVAATRCHRCDRHRVFGELEPMMAARMAIGKTWRCRDHEDCEAVRAEKRARQEAEIAAALVRDPCDEIFVRESQYGPELVFRHGNNGTVVNLAEIDLPRLAVVLAQRQLEHAGGGEADVRVDEVAE